MVAPETYVGAALAANAVWSLLDQRRYEDIFRYLMPDCAWERPDGWRHGYDELRASFLARPADLLSRHIVTNFIVEAADDGSLKGRCYVVAYFAKTENHDATQRMEQPYIIGDIDLEFVQSGRHILIAKISVHQTFAIEALIK